MKKLISLLLSVTMLASIPVYIASAEENDVFIPAPVGTPSEWAELEIYEAMDNGIITDSVCLDFQTDITREQFCELIIKVFEKFNSETVSTEGISYRDTENESILKASALGIVNGYGEGIFAPDDKITREQIAAMLVRMLDKSDIGLDINKYNDNDFSDKETISEWALPFVNFLYDTGIMKGTGEDTIDPLGNTTCEQGVILAYRTFKNYEYYGKDIMATILEKDFISIATDEMACVALAEELVKNPVIGFSPMVAEAEEGYLPGFGEEEIKGFKEAAVFAPMIGTIPFMGYIFALEDGADKEAFMKELGAKAKLNWNICTTADQLVIAEKGNKVFFVMCPYGIEE